MTEHGYLVQATDAWPNKTVVSCLPAAAPRRTPKPTPPRYSVGMSLAAYASGFNAGYSDPATLEGVAFLAWHHGRNEEESQAIEDCRTALVL